MKLEHVFFRNIYHLKDYVFMIKTLVKLNLYLKVSIKMILKLEIYHYLKALYLII